MSRLALLALLAVPLTGAGGPQTLSVSSEAQPGFRALWAASIEARAERVACLASAEAGDTLRILRILPLSSSADSTAVSAATSLERCGPPDWQGTVHTHIPLAGGQHSNPLFSGADRGVMLMWWQRWKQDGTFCLLYAEGQAHCEIDGSRLVILPSARY